MARGIRSPLAALLCAIVLFSTNVFAVAAVLGVDLGTEYIKGALVKPGIPLEIVLTKDARRKETSAVAFKPSVGQGPKAGSYPERFYGSDAIALAPRFPGDVYPNLKSLLGLPVNHPSVQEYAAQHPALQLKTHPVKGTAAFKSATAFSPDEDPWLVEELLAMELQSLRANAEALAGSGSPVRSVVLTVPPFYTVEEKRAVESAAELAGLRVLSLISDGMAVGLHYATSRQFPNINEGGKPEHHLVFDMGAGSTKASVVKFQSRTVKDVGKFNKTVQEVQVVGSGWDRTLGGDFFNSLIVEDMIAQFVDSPKAQKASVTVDAVKSHGRTVAKLNKEAARLRHVLSANTNTQASMEGLFNDVDFKYKISRSDFEALADRAAQRISAAVQGALDAAGLGVADLESVILHGGASRTPLIQRELEKIFGDTDKIRSSVNADEAAVFGAGFRAAEISPSFRVKEIRISEPATYPAGMRWTDDKQKARNQKLWTATSALGAPPKEVTFSNREDFSATFYQVAPSLDDGAVTSESDIGVLTTKNLSATTAHLVEKYACEPADVHFRVGLRLASENGEVEVTKATVECEADEPEKEGFVDGVKNLFGFGKPKDQEPLQGEGTEGASESADASSSASTSSPPEESSSSTSETASSSTTSTSSSEASPSGSADAKSKGGSTKKRLVVIPVDYTLEKTGRPALSKSDITALKDRLKAFDTSDRSRRLREEALNQLESLTYRTRDLLDNEEFVAASTAEERQTLEKRRSETSDWLYEDGADASREELKNRRKLLQEIITPIQDRIEQGSKRPELVKGLREALDQSKTFVANIKKNIVEYEAFQSSQSASSSASSTSTSSDTTAGSNSEATEAATAATDDFAGLEDDAPSSATASPETEDVLGERGPVPPMYTLDDLRETEELHESISKWLEEKAAEQDKLGPTDDPVLQVKDLTEKRSQLDKVGMDLAMKGVRNFEKKKPKKSKAPKSKSKSSKTAKAKKPASTIEIKPGSDGNLPSEEELAEMLRQHGEETGGAAGQAGNDKRPMEEARKGKAEEADTERKHEEL